MHMKKSEMEFSLNAQYKNLALARSLLRSFLELEKISAKDKVQLISVIDELATNVVEHAYAENNKKEKLFRVHVLNDENKINIEVEDFGGGFDSGKRSKEEGGMGIRIVKGIVDNFQIENKENGSVIRVIKKIDQEG